MAFFDAISKLLGGSVGRGGQTVAPWLQQNASSLRTGAPAPNQPGLAVGPAGPTGLGQTMNPQLSQAGIAQQIGRSAGFNPQYQQLLQRYMQPLQHLLHMAPQAGAPIQRPLNLNETVMSSSPKAYGAIYAQDPTNPAFNGVDPMIFGYPPDNTAR